MLFGLSSEWKIFRSRDVPVSDNTTYLLFIMLNPCFYKTNISIRAVCPLSSLPAAVQPRHSFLSKRNTSGAEQTATENLRKVLGSGAPKHKILRGSVIEALKRGRRARDHEAAQVFGNGGGEGGEKKGRF